MLEVRLLGTFAIRHNGRPVVLSSRTAQSLFAYLVSSAGMQHRRERLAGMFWPDVPEEKARAYLRHELWVIRKAVPTNSAVDYLVSDEISVSFNPASKYWLDLLLFKNLSESPSIADLMTALTLYQGEFLPGFYEEWVSQEREHVQVLFDQEMRQLLTLLEGEKRWPEMLEWAERWISLGQAPETAYRALILAYDGLGDRARITATYRRCVQALYELDLEPSEETRSLAFQKAHKSNLPIPLTSFIGRAQQQKEIVELFSRSRLITLTGSGGVGKTRLAIHTVADVFDRFPDGVWFLDLAPLNNEALIPTTVASLVGLRESGEIPVIDLLINY